MTIKITKPSINVREELADLKNPTGIAGEAMLRAETPQEQFNLISAGRRRMNLNGAMSVFQRGSVTGVSTHAFGADRYLIHNDVAGTIALTEDADVPDKGGFQSSYKIACTGTETFNSTSSNLIMIHRLEGQDSQCTNFGKPSASPLTLSFWIKSNRAGDFSVNFENELPVGGGADRGYQIKQTLNQADTWEYKVVTIEGDAASGKGFTNNTTKGLCFEISLSKAGSTFSGTAPKAYWHDLANAERSTHNQHFFGDSTSNYWKITGVQLELGKVATPFEHRSYGEELALCQRYYERLNGPAGWYNAHGYGTNIYLVIPWEVPKRTASGSVYYSNTNFASMITAYGNTGGSSAIDGVITGVSTAIMGVTGLGLDVALSASTYTPFGTSVMYRLDASHWIAYDAEL
jgi:hypothetical protein